MSDSDTALVNEVRRRLDRSLTTLSPGLEAELGQARSAALRLASQDSLNRNHKAREQLDSALLPSGTVSHNLDRLRALALAQRPDASRQPADSVFARLTAAFATLWQSIPAKLVASCCVVLAMATLVLNTQLAPDSFNTSDEIALLASADEIELYENLDFYLWLAEEGFPE